MNTRQNMTPAFRPNSSQMAAGGVLAAAGTLLGVAGMIVGASALMTAARRWFLELDVPPAEVAKHRLGQAKAATIAGARTWQQHSNGVPARSRS
jgi:hypothetical protein